jgi:copper oxidase (laccase) domain-containing protein
MSHILETQPDCLIGRGSSEAPAMVAQTTVLPGRFQTIYSQRNQEFAPPLSGQFDEQTRAIYSGLDPKTSFFPVNNREHYPDESPENLEAIATALNDHGARSLRVARASFVLKNVEWLGLAGKSGSLVIDGDAILNRVLSKNSDDLGYIRRSPGTDIGVVGPRRFGEAPITLAMGVADCLAIPVIDTSTEAFALAHAGRPGTGLRTAEKATYLLSEEFGSQPGDLIAFLGEGVCKACYTTDEKTFDDFVADFGGRTEIDKVIEQYPSALEVFETPEGKRIAVDLYAFNKYLLATQGVNEIIVAPNCTARAHRDCDALAGKEVPAEADQKFFSHVRAKGQTIGWQDENGHVVEVNTYHVTTPRNLAAITRF